MRSEVFFKEASKNAMIGHEGFKALRYLSIFRIEKPFENPGNRCLLLVDVTSQVAVDVRYKRVSNVPQLRFLRRRMGVAKRTQADAPDIDAELLSLRFIKVCEEGEAVHPPIAYVRGDFIRRADDGGFELAGANRFEHGPLYRMSCARRFHRHK
ncbi:MAG: hypothetical protein H0W53_16785, partial [Acidobacteria bacterium]|nr:hypothetical protein [Acidobacteriota bacterium]